MKRFCIELVLVVAGGDKKSPAASIKARLSALKRKYKGGIVFWHDATTSADRKQVATWARANKISVVPFGNTSLMLRLATERFKSGEKAGILMLPTQDADFIRSISKNCGLPLWEITQ